MSARGKHTSVEDFLRLCTRVVVSFFFFFPELSFGQILTSVIFMSAKLRLGSVQSWCGNPALEPLSRTIIFICWIKLCKKKKKSRQCCMSACTHICVGMCVISSILTVQQSSVFISHTETKLHSEKTEKLKAKLILPVKWFRLHIWPLSDEKNLLAPFDLNLCCLSSSTAWVKACGSSVGIIFSWQNHCWHKKGFEKGKWSYALSLTDNVFANLSEKGSLTQVHLSWLVVQTNTRKWSNPSD